MRDFLTIRYSYIPPKILFFIKIALSPFGNVATHLFVNAKYCDI